MAEPSAAQLRRDAYIYVRQSTLAQTIHNTESLIRQYDLAGRARALGWAEAQIVVIDDDLGRSGASAHGRNGFANLVADVGLGKAGIVLSLECSRLARNNSDLLTELPVAVGLAGGQAAAGVANVARHDRWWRWAAGVVAAGGAAARVA